MGLQVTNGLGRLSFVWWSFCGVGASLFLLVLTFHVRSESRWMAVAPLAALAIAYGLHKLTCWLIEGFAGAPVQQAPVPKSAFPIAVGGALLAGLLAANWPVPERLALAPSAPAPALAPFNGKLDGEKWWEKAPVIQPASEPDEAAALQKASEEVLRAYPYLSEPESVGVVRLILADRDQRMAQGKRADVALWEAARAIAPAHAPR